LSDQEGVVQESVDRMRVHAARMRESPAPSWMPFTTGMGIACVNHLSSPVRLKRRMADETKIPAAAVEPAERD